MPILTQEDTIDAGCRVIATIAQGVEVITQAMAGTDPVRIVLQRSVIKDLPVNTYKEVGKVRLSLLPSGFFSLFSALAIFSGASGLTPPASAQCVMTDVSVQVAVRGSKNPAHQENNVDMQAPGRCSGNSITQTGTQVYTGSADQVNQIRNSRQSLDGGSQKDGIGGPTIKVPVGVKVDVYNPAYDPSFMNKLGR